MDGRESAVLERTPLRQTKRELGETEVRRCKGCRARLNSYNPGPCCWPCNRRILDFSCVHTQMDADHTRKLSQYRQELTEARAAAREAYREAGQHLLACSSAAPPGIRGVVFCYNEPRGMNRHFEVLLAEGVKIWQQSSTDEYAAAVDLFGSRHSSRKPLFPRPIAKPKSVAVGSRASSLDWGFWSTLED